MSGRPDHVSRAPSTGAGDAWADRLVAALPDLWFRVSADGRFVGAGGPQQDFYVPAADFLGRHLGEVLPAEVARPLADACRRAADGTRERVQYTLEIAGVWRHFAAVVVGAGEGEAAMFVREVTKRVEAERRLADSERLFRAVVDLANEGVWMTDADACTTFVTERMASMLGYQVAEMIGRPATGFIDPAIHERFRSRFLREGEGIAEAGASRLVGRGGEIVPVTVAATPIEDDSGRFVGAIALVTDERDAARSERELLDAHRLLGAVAEAHEDVFYVGEILADGSYHEIFTGPGTHRLLGGSLPGGSDPGEGWSHAVHPDDEAIFAEMNAAISQGEIAQREYRLVGLDGVTRWVHDRAKPRPVGDDGRRVFDGVVTDISARRAQERQLLTALEQLNATHAAVTQLARTDALTGLANRRAFGEALDREFQRAERTGLGVGIVLIDVDHFKRINDTHGHETGDEALVAVAQRLRANLRPYDTLARWGGEEFIVLVADLPDPSILQRIADDLLAGMRAAPIATMRGPLAITASAGGAYRAAGRNSSKAVIAAADRALYAAKRRGRDQAVMADDVTARDSTPQEPEAIRLAEGLAIAASIREAIPPRHCAEVADLAARLAVQLGLPADTAFRARLGGWLHDIGKLAVPDAVLRNAAASALSKADRAALRRHSEVGAEIVAGVPSLAEAQYAVRHHHERYDGTGYPDRLVGDRIPIEARIIAVADAYSAITAGRAYQPALDQDRAVAALRASAGTSLDPTVVSALTSLLETAATTDSRAA